MRFAAVRLIARGKMLRKITGARPCGDCSASSRRNNLHAHRAKGAILARIGRIVGESVLVANVASNLSAGELHIFQIFGEKCRTARRAGRCQKGLPITLRRFGLFFSEQPDGVNQSARSLRFAQRGIRREDVIAFGDMPNDLPMLTWAGHAVAVANAHPDVIAAADEVTASNDEAGVARVLERLFSLS